MKIQEFSSKEKTIYDSLSVLQNGGDPTSLELFTSMDIADKLGLNRGTVSSCLTVLRRAGWVRCITSGRSPQYYALASRMMPQKDVQVRKGKRRKKDLTSIDLIQQELEAAAKDIDGARASVRAVQSALKDVSKQLAALERVRKLL